MVKSLPNVFTLILTKIVNVSLASYSQFPTTHKHAVVTLQHVQDTAGTGKLLCVACAWTHTPPLLTVSSRIQFKVCTLMFVINHGTAPQYLTKLVRHCDDTRLQSSVHDNFVVSCTWLHAIDKAFSVAGRLPVNSSHGHLVTHTSRHKVNSSQDTSEHITKPPVLIFLSARRSETVLKTDGVITASEHTTRDRQCHAVRFGYLV